MFCFLRKATQVKGRGCYLVVKHLSRQVMFVFYLPVLCVTELPSYTLFQCSSDLFMWPSLCWWLLGNSPFHQSCGRCDSGTHNLEWDDEFEFPGNHGNPLVLRLLLLSALLSVVFCNLLLACLVLTVLSFIFIVLLQLPRAWFLFVTLVIPCDATSFMQFRFIDGICFI